MGYPRHLQESVLKTYVIAPNFSIAPPPQIKADVLPTPLPRVQLGDILVDPFGPELVAINRDARVAPETKHIEEVDRKGRFTATRKSLLEGRFGVVASLLAALGIGAVVDIDFFVQRNSSEKLSIDSLETHELRVTDDYVKKVLASVPVSNYTKQFPKSQLYIVSGLKIAKGVSSQSDAELETGVDIGGGGPSKAANIKLLKFLWKRSQGQSFETSTDFVLALQLRRIKYKAGELQHELSLEKVSLSDGTAVPAEVVRHYEGTDDDISAAEAIADGEILKIDGEEGLEVFDLVDLFID
ncbi:hypothetical protein EsH8_XI_000124 [Colletotrichum jinshuiense]